MHRLSATLASPTAVGLLSRGPFKYGDFSLSSSTLERSMKQPIYRRSQVRRCATVLLHVKCDVATPGDADSGPLVKTSQPSKSPVARQAAVSTLVIREARLTDFWEVSDTHCGAFFPNVKFPMDFILRSDRVMAMIGNLSLPTGQRRLCLVAIESTSIKDLTTGNQVDTSHSVVDDFARKVSGALTMDTLAEFLPRRGPKGHRRTGIAYVSNVAVRATRRRRGIALRLIREAQRVARTWGCRSMALHCDGNNAAAEGLYSREGFRRVNIPVGAKWPQPQALPGANLQLMMKHLSDES